MHVDPNLYFKCPPKIKLTSKMFLIYNYAYQIPCYIVVVLPDYLIWLQFKFVYHSLSHRLFNPLEEYTFGISTLFNPREQYTFGISSLFYPLDNLHLVFPHFCSLQNNLQLVFPHFFILQNDLHLVFPQTKSIHT